MLSNKGKNRLPKNTRLLIFAHIAFEHALGISSKTAEIPYMISKNKRTKIKNHELPKCSTQSLRARGELWNKIDISKHCGIMNIFNERINVYEDDLNSTKKEHMYYLKGRNNGYPQEHTLFRKIEESIETEPENRSFMDMKVEYEISITGYGKFPRPILLAWYGRYLRLIEKGKNSFEEASRSMRDHPFMQRINCIPEMTLEDQIEALKSDKEMFFGFVKALQVLEFTPSMTREIDEIVKAIGLMDEKIESLEENPKEEPEEIIEEIVEETTEPETAMQEMLESGPPLDPSIYPGYKISVSSTSISSLYRGVVSRVALLEMHYQKLLSDPNSPDNILIEAKKAFSSLNKVKIALSELL